MDIQDIENEIPYNPMNKNLISDINVEEILHKYNVIYKVKNIELFRTAFTHKSYLQRNIWTKEQLDEKKAEIGEKVLELRKQSYEELEFFGDAILDLVAVIYLSLRFPNQSEGFYTKLKSKLVSGTSLSKIAKALDFHKYIIISKSIEDKNGRHSDKILEDVFEAFLGALFKDIHGNVLDNFYTCYNFIFNLLDNVNDDFDYASLLLFDNNYKDQLLKYFHQKKWGNPIYIEIKVEENINSKIFSIGILDPMTNDKKKYLSIGIGSTKKKAEQQASKDVLRKFGVLIEDQYN
jgi:ribonuclease-3